MSESLDPSETLVPDSVIPHNNLPPLRYRDLPEAPPWTQLVGPSVMLAGLALGSGEFIFWPFITFKAGFIFFWACMIGVITQFFINMEIERWTLVTGESAITGFCRLSRHWAWVMLILNFLPWVWPGWATGASTLISWMCLGAVPTTTAPLPDPVAVVVPADLQEHVTVDVAAKRLTWRGPIDETQRDTLRGLSDNPGFQTAADAVYAQMHEARGIKYEARYVQYIGVATLLLVGIVLTASPVVYNTVEKLQFILVGLIFVIAVLLSILIVRWDAVAAMLRGTFSVGSMPGPESGLDFMALLGALAFAGAGGTMNLGQSNFIRDKGYGMGRYVGRITSPITGQDEPIADVGYHFPHTPENMRRWKAWWRAANIEHFCSFYLTCVVCLVLLSLLSYSLFYDASGRLKPGAERFGEDLSFVWGEADLIEGMFSPTVGKLLRTLFFVMGTAILFTTELGVLDAAARISADAIKVNFLRTNDAWPLGRLYFLLLWAEILIGSGILLASAMVPSFKQPLFLLKTSAAMNGGVMFTYTMILLYLNTKILARDIAMSPLRFVAMVWGCGFFGYFTMLALKIEVIPYILRQFGAS